MPPKAEDAPRHQTPCLKEGVSRGGGFMRIILDTKFPQAVADLLARYELVELHTMTLSESSIEINYPDDALSQEFRFWLAMAQGCGLVYDAS